MTFSILLVIHVTVETAEIPMNRWLVEEIMEHPDHVATKPPEDDLSSSVGVVNVGCCQGTCFTFVSLSGCTLVEKRIITTYLCNATICL